ncbi:DUF3124 domain-containing protein [Polaribacter litorisediminis]|uniref:DUF3124 domain-containing protein n=1 Tax=Polaribacter litorisediminis TaxID=1908341 RepID=UPI001CBC84C3|nr:DUF3124 domain-containing protein [Polaribacter litorisediminis]UAM98376.1 DUF3124 domain-containing protein [Polaribacter litorisediminis]
MNKFSAISLLCIFLLSCVSPDPNLDKKGKNELKALEIERTISKEEQNFHDTIYIPIYSDIYFDQQNQKVLLAATLSIRNTSYNDSLFISKIDYFNTEGKLVRSYVQNLINLPPMATVNYVIEKDDDTGGPGANFIVEINSKNKNVKPVVQAVMIGEAGNKGFSFATDGYSLKKKK